MIKLRCARDETEAQRRLLVRSTKDHIDARAAQPGVYPWSSEDSAMSVETLPARTEQSRWRRIKHIDPTDAAAVSAWAARLCLAPGELREIMEELAPASPVAKTGIAVATLAQDHNDMPCAGATA